MAGHAGVSEPLLFSAVDGAPYCPRRKLMTGGWVIYACRTPFAVEVAEVIWRRGEEVAALVDNLAAHSGTRNPGAFDPAAEIDAPLTTPDGLGEDQLRLAAVVPLITPGHRFAVEDEARKLGLSAFPPLVDPTATVARSAALGEGSVLNAASVIGAGARLGRFVNVNRGASVGHHNLVEDFASLGPGCLLSGDVQIGRGAFVGTGAVCAPRVSVGANAVVGAGAVVLDDLPAGAVAVGNPAVVIRQGDAGYGGVGVPA